MEDKKVHNEQKYSNQKYFLKACTFSLAFAFGFAGGFFAFKHTSKSPNSISAFNTNIKGSKKEAFNPKKAGKPGDNKANKKMGMPGKTNENNKNGPGNSAMPMDSKNGPGSMGSNNGPMAMGGNNISGNPGDHEPNSGSNFSPSMPMPGNNGGYTVPTSTVTTSNTAANVQVSPTPQSNSSVTVTSINLNKTSCTLNIGDTDSLSAVLEPNDAVNKEIKWASLNSDVCSTDNTGKITALKEGTAIITATSTDSNKTAFCMVTVNKAFSQDALIFKDKNLEDIIRHEINKPTGTLYKNDVLSITKLDCKNKNITYLDGVENLSNLQAIDLSNNNIADTKSLGYLTKLKELNLSQNPINDTEKETLKNTLIHCAISY